MEIIKRPRFLLTDNDITDEKIYNARRQVMKVAALTVATTIIPAQAQAKNYPGKDLSFSKNKNFQDKEATAYDKITTYNNFYEFSLSKEAPAKLAHTLKPEPWTIEISGEVQKPMTIDMNDILSKYPLEERIYHFRCVEGWAMTVPSKI